MAASSAKPSFATGFALAHGGALCCGMSTLLDRFGCLVQVGIGAAVGYTLREVLPWWGVALAAVGASYVGTWLLALVVARR